MALAYITLALLAITVASFIVGTIWLAKYAFRLGTGPGLGVLLFPPYTFYFAFYKLEQESKDRPTALWMFGLVASVLIILIFSAPLNALLTGGGLDALAAVPDQPEQKKTVVVDEPEPPAVKEEPATTPPAVADQPDAGTPAADAGAAAAAPAADAPAAGTEAAPAATGTDAAAPAAQP